MDISDIDKVWELLQDPMVKGVKRHYHGGQCVRMILESPGILTREDLIALDKAIQLGKQFGILHIEKVDGAPVIIWERSIAHETRRKG